MTSGHTRSCHGKSERMRTGLMFLLVTAGIVLSLLGYSTWLTVRSEQLFPPLGKFVEVDGLKLHYAEMGTGKPVVLLHGASGSLRDYVLSIFGDVARNHRAIAIDRPGHGYSDRVPANGWNPAVQAAQIRAGLQKLGVEKPLLVGHSWSGSVVLAYALAYPDEISGMVLLGAATHPWKGSPPKWYNRIATTPYIGDLFTRLLVTPIGQASIAGAIKNTFAPNSPPELYREQAGVSLVLRPANFRANAEDVINLRAFLAEQSKRYGEIGAPLTIVTGLQDRTVTPKIHSKALHAQVPHSKLVTFEGVGHMPHHVRPEAVTAEIEALLRAGSAHRAFQPVSVK